jgi:replicative DNA helicase
MGEDGGVRNVCQGTEYRKEYGCSGNVERFPLTEDHNSEGKESGTGYADFEVPGGNGRNDVGKSADTAECIVAKNRHGETSTVPLGWDGAHTRFMDVDFKR